TEKDKAVTVGGVETDPGFPHRRLAGNDRWDLGHSHLQGGITGRQFFTRERIDEMENTQGQDYPRTYDHEDAGKHCGTFQCNRTPPTSRYLVSISTRRLKTDRPYPSHPAAQ